MTLFATFTEPLLLWFQHHGRHDLPWQHPRTPYRVWVSEIMLQQTQVKTVIPYFKTFMARFPDIQTLAEAEEDDILSLWSGLGYYSRARNLHKTARQLKQHFNSLLPDTFEDLIKLPGIGPSTAAAILSLAFNKPAAILDGNVKRILCRYFEIEGPPDKTHVNQQLWKLAKACLPAEHHANYTQAIMDLGALCCTLKNPDCNHCPLKANCLAYQHGTVLTFPNKKKKIAKPSKTQQFLLMHTNNTQIYLEKRTPNGLWGGLWCTPMIEENACLVSYLKKHYEVEAYDIQPLLTMKHTFTHFHLHIKAWSLNIQIPEGVSMSQFPGRWFSINEAATLGISKPIKTLLDAFMAQQ